MTQLEAKGLVVGVDDHVHAVGHCQRCSTVVEPLLSTQWFVKIKPLADRAIEEVADGHTTFVPENWRRTYDEWMVNIHDWCISRQLWWGAPDSCLVLRRVRCGGRCRGDTHDM